MNFKRFVLIITFLLITVWLLTRNVPTVQAQTVEELRVQITALQSQINQLKTQLAEIEKKLASIAESVSKLTPKIPEVKPKVIKPESEYKCPDVNGDGIVDVSDTYTVSLIINTCLGQAKYNSKADVDGDNCITSADSNYVSKYYGKKIGEITQCTGVITFQNIEKEVTSIAERIPQLTQQIKEITQVTVKPESEYKCPDVNGDGIVDVSDTYTVSLIINTCLGQAKYNSKADVDGDNCITSADSNYVSKYYGKKIGEITQCAGVVVTPVKPESEYKCPDVNGDGIVDVSDTYTVSLIINTCLGQAKYNSKADVDGDNCITSVDSNYVSKYYGKNASEIAQCGEIAKYSLVLSVSGQGTVSPSPGTNTHNKGAVVTITATPASGWEFSYWQGADNNSINPTTVTMSSNKIVTAFFKVKTVLESEYKCPDINGDGIVDVSDTYTVSLIINTCLGQAKYNSKADVDGDNCITSADSNYVSKYYGKNASEIAQCKTTSALKNMESMIAAVANSIYQLAEQIKELFK